MCGLHCGFGICPYRCYFSPFSTFQGFAIFYIHFYIIFVFNSSLNIFEKIKRRHDFFTYKEMYNIKFHVLQSEKKLNNIKKILFIIFNVHFMHVNGSIINSRNHILNIFIHRLPIFFIFCSSFIHLVFFYSLSLSDRISVLHTSICHQCVLSI